MRLLNTSSLELQFFMPSTVPDYVILSHRWLTLSSEECSYTDLSQTPPLSDPRHPARQKEGFTKLQGACRLAFQDGYSWIWIDSCCIDKSSSAELQEAINSMWKYYAEANICYVYMSDVKNEKAGWDGSFKGSEWFNRGWTLQELIAPVCVEFYAEDWSAIGTKSQRHEEIANITSIAAEVLVRSKDRIEFSVAERFSWVAHRKVTREEDEAYSLLGLFNVNIPLLYGEGRESAFIRLQEAIFVFTTDHAMFLFRYSLNDENQPLLADSPTRFCDRRECKMCLSSGLRTFQCLSSSIPYKDIVASNRWGSRVHEQIMSTRDQMSTNLPLLRYQDVASQLMSLGAHEIPYWITHVAVLNRSLKGYETGALCILLFSDNKHNFNRRPGVFLLPSLEAFESKLRDTKILIVPDEVKFAQDVQVATSFRGDGRTFLIQNWSSTKNVRDRPLLVDGRTAGLIVYTSEDTILSGEESPGVFCHILDRNNPFLSVNLCLRMIGMSWSIREVSEMIRGTPQAEERVQFSSEHFTDRCSVSLWNGSRLSISLRRLAAACRARDGNFTSECSYQIAVKYL